MKRTALFLATVALFAFTACGGAEEKTDAEKAEQSESEVEDIFQALEDENAETESGTDSTAAE